MIPSLRRFRNACLGLLVLTLPSFGADAPKPPVAEPPAAGSPLELRAGIDRFIDQPRFSGALWGVQIASLDSGQVLYERAPERRMSPASNSKLYVAALALDRLGGDYRIATPLLATAAVTPDGDLPGELVVAGRGDPSWNPRREKQEFWTAFEPFVVELRRAGVKRIRGDVIADAGFFHCTPQGAGWTADDLNDYYGAEISAITLEENYVDLRVRPAAIVGQPCTVDLLQPCTGLEIDNRTTTGATGTPRHVTVLRLPGETRVTIFGRLPVGGADEMTEATVPRPAQWFATALKAALERAGIQVGGGARSVRWPEPPLDLHGARQLGVIQSPPLRDMIGVLLKASQNLRTDLLFADLGEKERTPETPAWRTSDELALTVLRSFLQAHGFPPGDVIFEDGSGLSRNNLTTARATVMLLRFMAGHREHEAFFAGLPIAGVDGTLRKRMKGTAAEGNVHAKTGTLRWANAMSGYVTTAAGEHLVFSLMLNRAVASAERSSRDDLDEIALMLARYRGAR